VHWLGYPKELKDGWTEPNLSHKSKAYCRLFERAVPKKTERPKSNFPNSYLVSF